MARTLAICNQKGGVGKTTTTFHFARAAVRAGRRVLVVDADPQGNLTAVITASEVGDDQVGLADALSDRADDTIRDVIVPGTWDGLDVVPTSGTMLEAVRDELIIAGAGRESRMRFALAALYDDYDLILIDCAPALDQLTINALVAADGAVVVTHSKLFSSNGLAKLLGTIESVQQHYHSKLTIAGVLVNQHETQTVSGRSWYEELTSQQGLPVLAPPIPKKVVISDAIEAGVALDEWRSPEAAVLGEMYAEHLKTLEGAVK